MITASHFFLVLYLGIIPRWATTFGTPCIVNDFPLPVCPYANTVALYPSVTDWLNDDQQLIVRSNKENYGRKLIDDSY